MSAISNLLFQAQLVKLMHLTMISSLVLVLLCSSAEGHRIQLEDQLAEAQTLVDSAAKILEGEKKNDCPFEEVDKWGTIYGCGNFGCVASVEVASQNWAMKVTKIANTTENDIMAALSKLGDGKEGCPSGELSSANNAPCTLLPNVMKVLGGGSCDCADVPEDTKKLMVNKASSRGKNIPSFKGDCASIITEALPSDLEKYNPPPRAKEQFYKSTMLQILFAYHVTFTELGFAHNDVMSDNFGFRCTTKMGRYACKAPAKGTQVYCYKFEPLGKFYCFDLFDTDGTAVALIDFGQSKMNQKKTLMADRMGVKMLAGKFGISLNVPSDSASSETPWASVIKTSFAEFEKSEAPAGAKIFGY